MMQPSLVTIAMRFISQGTIVIFAITEVRGWGVKSKPYCVLKTLYFQGILFK